MKSCLIKFNIFCDKNSYEGRYRRNMSGYNKTIYDKCTADITFNIAKLKASTKSAKICNNIRIPTLTTAL